MLCLSVMLILPRWDIMQFEIDGSDPNVFQGAPTDQTKKDSCDLQESFFGRTPILNEVGYFVGWT